MPACHKCGKELKVDFDYGRQDTCPGCGAHTRACLNCLNYDRSRYNECKETIADRVVDKEKSNFCDHFKPGDPKSGEGDSRSAALRAAEALFKKK